MPWGMPRRITHFKAFLPQLQHFTTKQKPIIVFMHEDPDSRDPALHDEKPELRKKFKEFHHARLAYFADVPNQASDNAPTFATY